MLLFYMFYLINRLQNRCKLTVGQIFFLTIHKLLLDMQTCRMVHMTKQPGFILSSEEPLCLGHCKMKYSLSINIYHTVFRGWHTKMCLHVLMIIKAQWIHLLKKNKFINKNKLYDNKKKYAAVCVNNIFQTQPV